jgi:hypothetical protein
MAFFPPLVAGRFPCLPCTALVVILLGFGCPVHAELQYQVAASSSVGVSDNPASRSDDASVRTEALLAARGHFQLTHIGRLTLDRISYGIMAMSWTGNLQNVLLTHTLALSSEIEAGPETRIALHGGATLTQMSMLDTAAPTDPQTVGARPAGDQRFLSVDAGEALAWQMSGSWHISESLEGRLYHPLDNQQSGSLDNRSATFETELAHVWQRDSGGLRGRLGAIDAGTGMQTGQTTPGRNHAEFAQFELTWRHDWTPDITHRLAGGLFVLQTDELRVLPAAAASIAWQGTGYGAELRAAHTADTNIYLGTAYERSLVGLTVGLPLDRHEELQLFAAADLEHDSIIAVSGGPPGAVNVFFLRCGLHWQPGDLFSFGLEYWFRDQRASATDPGSSALPTLRRQMAMLTIEIQYPPRGYYR